MTKPVRIHPAAEAELAEAINWYEERQTGLGLALLALAERCVEQIRKGLLKGSLFPGVPDKSNARRVLLRKYPYSVVFCERKFEIVILAFAHNKRRHGYWQTRNLFD